MNCYMKGAIGGIVSLLFIEFLIVPQYSDYMAAAETSQWLSSVEPLRLEIEENARKLKTLNGAAKGVTRPSIYPDTATLFELRDSGEIIIGGGRHGQLVILTPTLDGTTVKWRCVGGSAHDVTAECRSARRAR